MEQRKFNPDESWTIAMFFLEGTWDNRQQWLSPAIEDGLGDYLSILTGDPASSSDWVRNYETVFGKALSRKDLLTEEEIFTAIIEFTAYFSRMCGLSELISLLHSMRYKPEKYPHQWKLWQKAIQCVLDGGIEEFGIIRNKN